MLVKTAEKESNAKKQEVYKRDSHRHKLIAVGGDIEEVMVAIQYNRYVAGQLEELISKRGTGKGKGRECV